MRQPAAAPCRAAASALAAALAAACYSTTDLPREEPPPVEPPPVVQPPVVPPPAADSPPVYAVEPPAGKLPWPHHAPEWTGAEYTRAINDLWVINNYPLYQGSALPSSLYLHTGLDVVLPNGTPIYAIAAGTVRANIGGDEFYRTLVIEDEDHPGYAWTYTHINGFRVHPGDRVYRGTHLGHVHFRGLEHIHLTRSVLIAGGSWQRFEDVVDLPLAHHFVFIDTEPPIFDTPFRYVRNMTDSAFARGDDGITTVSGDVDIVVGIRDPGEWTRSPVPYGGPLPYGDRHNPSRIEYDITAPDGTVHRHVAFDMAKLAVPSLTAAGRPDQVLTLYQHYDSVSPAARPVGNNNRRFNYYVITNSTGEEIQALALLNPQHRNHAWRTAAADAEGRRRFPDGEYSVTVRALDAKGNLATRTETVRVRN